MARVAVFKTTMYPLRIFTLLLCGVLIAAAEDSPRKLAYELDAKVYVANLDGTAAKKIGAGLGPDISPDGKRVAFNTEEEAGKTFARHIAVAEVATGKLTVFKDVPSDNAYYPKWSPDGAQLLFTIYDGHLWHLAFIKADGTGFRYVRKDKDTEAALDSPCWAPDGNSFFAQDMKNIYRIGLDGTEIAHWEIAKSVSNGDMSGDGRIDVSPDGQTLLLGVDMNEEAHRKNWDGPFPAQWTFDLATKKATRLTSKKLFGWDGCWLDGATMLFLSQAPNEKDASLYRMAVAGGKMTLIAKGARQPSVSR